MKEMPFTVLAAASLLVVAGAWVFDRSLELGNLHGVALRLYGLIGVGLVFLSGAVTSLVLWRKRQASLARQWALATLGCPLVAAILVLALSK